MSGVLAASCCCGSPSGPCCCFCFGVTPQYGQYCDISCQILDCTIPSEICGPIPSFGVQNTITSSFGALTPKQFVTWKAPLNNCECYHECRDVYTWTPDSTTWNTAVCFKIGATGGPCFVEIQSSSAPAYGTIDVCQYGTTPSCASTVIPYCGCCGLPGNQFLYRIRYSNRICSATVNGSCGPVTFGSVGCQLGQDPAWFTQFEAFYCIRKNGTGLFICQLELVAIRMIAPSPMVSYGPDAFVGPGSCDCENNSVIDNCTLPADTYCAPFTNNGAVIYALAGSPPMILTGNACICNPQQ